MKKIVILLLSFVLCFSVVSCSKKKTNDEKPTELVSETVLEETEPEETEPVEYDFYQYEGETFDIETPYCNLQYPESWEDMIYTEQIKNADDTEIKFYAYLDYYYIPMFSVIFGVSDENDWGILVTDDGTVGVSISNFSYDTKYNLSNESLLTYEMMCEDVNVIISGLVYNNGLQLN